MKSLIDELIHKAKERLSKTNDASYDISFSKNIRNLLTLGIYW